MALVTNLLSAIRAALHADFVRVDSNCKNSQPKMTKPSSSFLVAVVLLGAGASSRMGKPKMLLPWAQSTILGHLIELWKQLGAEQIAVVSAPEDAALNAELDRVDLRAEDR